MILFFEKESDEYGYITLSFANGQSVEVSPFETKDGKILYEVEPDNSGLSIYDIAKMFKCEVVLVHVKTAIYGMVILKSSNKLPKQLKHYMK